MASIDHMTDPLDEEEAPAHPADDVRLPLRIAEAVLFASPEPVSEAMLALRLPEGSDIRAIVGQLEADYAGRGIELVRVGDAWRFKTAEDVASALTTLSTEERKLSRAALETLAIIAYHQPVTRAEIEDIRGVSTSKGIMDTLLDAGFIRLRGRRRSPGRPVTFGTTTGFLDHFGLSTTDDLPGIEDLRGLGLLERAGGDPNPYRSAEEAPLDDDDMAEAGDDGVAESNGPDR